MKALSALWALYWREVIRFLRQRSRLIGSLLTPILFWFLLGGGIGATFEGYFEFFFPGVLALSVLFTAIFSTMSVIEDRHQGFLQGVLVSPVSRLNIVLSKVLAGASLGMFQGLVLSAVAWLSGMRWGGVVFVEALILLFVMGAALTALGFVFAWKLDSSQGYHSIMNMVLMPMWLLSGAIFPVDGGSGVFRWIAAMNPLSYAMRALRELLGDGNNLYLLQGILVMLLLMVACSALSIAMMKKSAPSA
jgi:ABC-2 type transport system permease protein